MAFWRRDPMEAAFWEDNTTRQLLLTIDKYFWPIACFNIVTSMTSARRFFHPCAMIVSGIMLFIIGLTTSMTAVAIRRDPERYYRHRQKIMVCNRVGRVVAFAITMLYMNVDKVEKNVQDRLLRGKHPMLFVLILLAHAIGNHQMWGLYFLLPVRLGIWLDLLQQGMRLVVTVMYCVRVIQIPPLRQYVTSLCTTMNTFLNTDMLIPLGVPTAPMALFDARCVEDGPLLLTLFSWWFWGCFWPTFTVWYCERLLKKRFMRRQQGIEGEGGDLWVAIRNYLFINVTVACGSWQLLQLLLAYGSNRDRIVRALLYSPWRHLA